MNKLSFCSYTKTIRQMPENYLIASFRVDNWECVPDLAADRDLCILVFTELLNYDSKYQSNGQVLLETLNKIADYTAGNKKIEAARHYLCDSDDLTIEEQVKLIEEYKGNDDTLLSFIEGVWVWEPLESTLTVKQFLDSI